MAVLENTTYQAQYDRLCQNAQEPSWLTAIRQSAIERFTDLGLPTRRDEEWRFTPITPIVETPFATSDDRRSALTPETVAAVPFGDLHCTTLVFVNGRYAPNLSTQRPLPAGVVAASMADVLKSGSESLRDQLAQQLGARGAAFTALNTALFEDGGYIFVPRGVFVEDPIHLLFIATSPNAPTVSYPRNLILAGENSQCTIVESYVGLDEDVYLTNAITEVVAGENAFVDHYKLQQESLTAYHVGSMQLDLARNVNFTSHAITLGGAITRNEVGAVTGGRNIECTLNGLYLANGRRIVDNHTTIDHALPYCNSHEVYKGILDDRARGVFNGKIFVRQDAQKTDAKQTNKTLLLSPTAQINTKPQLEIFADDVKCTHGATIGQLDPDQLFYLQARGIPKDEARDLLVYAFAGDIISRIKVESARLQLDKALFTQLAKRADYDESEHEIDDPGA